MMFLKLYIWKSKLVRLITLNLSFDQEVLYYIYEHNEFFQT